MFANLQLDSLVTLVISILIAITCHEAMHSFVAHWLGDTTAKDAGRLTLNPLKHVDIYTTILLPVLLILFHLPPIFIARPVPFDPRAVRFGDYGAALMAIAGPFTNLALAALAALFAHTVGAHLSFGIVSALVLFIEVNVAFFVFNMIPFPPLDGSRLLYAFAPEPLREVMAGIEAAGFLPLLAFMLLGFSLISGLIGTLENDIITFLLR